MRPISKSILVGQLRDVGSGAPSEFAAYVGARTENRFDRDSFEGLLAGFEGRLAPEEAQLVSIIQERMTKNATPPPGSSSGVDAFDDGAREGPRQASNATLSLADELYALLPDLPTGLSDDELEQLRKVYQGRPKFAPFETNAAALARLPPELHKAALSTLDSLKETYRLSDIRLLASGHVIAKREAIPEACLPAGTVAMSVRDNNWDIPARVRMADASDHLSAFPDYRVLIEEGLDLRVDELHEVFAAPEGLKEGLERLRPIFDATHADFAEGRVNVWFTIEEMAASGWQNIALGADGRPVGERNGVSRSFASPSDVAAFDAGGVELAPAGPAWSDLRSSRPRGDAGVQPWWMKSPLRGYCALSQDGEVSIRLTEASRTEVFVHGRWIEADVRDIRLTEDIKIAPEVAEKLRAGEGCSVALKDFDCKTQARYIYDYEKSHVVVGRGEDGNAPQLISFEAPPTQYRYW